MAVGNIIVWLRQYPYLLSMFGIVCLLLGAWVALMLARRALAAFVARKTGYWYEALFGQHVMHRAIWVFPLVVIHQGLSAIPYLSAPLVEYVQRLVTAAAVVLLIRVLSALLAAGNDIYQQYPMAKHRPIKGYLQGAEIVVYFAGAIIIIAILARQSPWYFVSGLGALMAVFLLVFRDTLLSLVAGFQLTNDNLICVGDWIEMPQYGADGDVVDISLYAVRVQNWDQTVTIIPTHTFLQQSFKNWRGMRESGVRRIKRAVAIDMSTVRFLNDDEISRLGRFALLREYLDGKRQEIASYNQAHGFDAGGDITARRLTNIGTFRAYVTAYLRQHPHLHPERTVLVRQLAPTATGLPLEVYVFANDTAWAHYETIQADIFDHLLAVLPDFGLQVYQQPSGHDFTRLAPSLPTRRAA